MGHRRQQILLNILTASMLLTGSTGTATSPGATVIDTYPDWEGLTTISWSTVAQSFTAPADHLLLNYTTSLSPTNNRTLGFEIVSWNPASGPAGGIVFTQQVAWPTTGILTLSNLNLNLTPGAHYAAILDLGGYTGPSVLFQKNQNSYDQGNGAWRLGNGNWEYLQAGYNTAFRAEFAPIPEPMALSLAAGALLLVIARGAPGRSP
jgi:hypothetical protein